MIKKTQMTNLTRICFVSLYSLLLSCTGNDGETAKKEIKKAFEEKDITVDILPITYGDFNNELVVNGKLKALKKAELRFKRNEIIQNVFSEEGAKIQKGKVIASLEDFTVKNELQKALNQLESANLECQKMMIEYGLKLEDTLTIDKKITQAFKIKSGYNTAQTNYQKALYNKKHSRIVAPFNGVIANIEYKEYQIYDNKKPFCLLIDNTKFEVEFSVIDSEFSNIKVGRKVQISPYTSNQNYEGKVSEINPFVDKNGLIKIKAHVQNKDSKLLEGMTVKIVVQTILKNQIIVPKEAVVLRSGKEVVFTYKNKKAHWNYVEIASENRTSFAIKEGLKKEDLIIVSGNLSLSNGVKVNVEKE